jgi:Ca2+-binding RTX toxin-like protein
MTDFRRILVRGALAATLAGLLAYSPVAAARDIGLVCNYHPGTQTVVVKPRPTQRTFWLYAPRGVLGWNSDAHRNDCDGATVTNTARVLVEWTDSHRGLFALHLGFGPFEPGVGDDDERPEIEFEITLSSAKTFVVYGTRSDDLLVAGELGINLNADSDVDVTFTGRTSISLWGRDGDDVITAQGGYGTGGPDAYGLLLYGGRPVFPEYPFGCCTRYQTGVGDDTLTGGEGDDGILGGPGDDVLDGRGGADQVLGGENEDDVSGGAGEDELFGGGHKDRITGGPGRDDMQGDEGAETFHANDGEPDEIGGGVGPDVAIVDCGLDQVRSAERRCG